LRSRREIGARRSRCVREERAYLVPTRLDQEIGALEPSRGDQSPSGFEHGVTQDAGCPNVAEQAAFIAQPVNETRFGEEFVEPAAVRRRNTLAHRAAVGRCRCRLPDASPHRAADRRHEELGKLAVGGRRDVEPILETERDEIEPAARCGPEFAAGGA
jgi:hypothetical protein